MVVKGLKLPTGLYITLTFCNHTLNRSIVNRRSVTNITIPHYDSTSPVVQCGGQCAARCGAGKTTRPRLFITSSHRSWPILSLIPPLSGLLHLNPLYDRYPHNRMRFISGKPIETFLSRLLFHVNLRSERVKKAAFLQALLTVKYTSNLFIFIY